MSTKRNPIIGCIACLLVAIVLMIVCLSAAFAKDENKFVYELQNDCYVIKDIKNDFRAGWFGKERLVVPAVHKNKKVVTLEKIAAKCLRELVISEGIETISENALTYNAEMSKVTLPHSLKSLGVNSFANTGITSIDITENLTSIGEGAFSGCNMLKSVTVAIENPVYHSANNCIIETASKILVSGCNKSIIPSDGTVTSIGNYAFSDYTNITNITIPDSVTSIGNNAFSGCSNLKNITIPDSVTAIEDSAFVNTAYYKESENWENHVLYIGKYLIVGSLTLTGGYTVKDGTKLIADNAFSDCRNLTSITVPESVTSIGSSVFSSCTKLKQIQYGGTIAQWETVVKNTDWNKGMEDCTIHCTDGDIVIKK